MPFIALGTGKPKKTTSQCQKPRGLFGRFVLWSMNRRHSAVTDWGLHHVVIEARDTILDAGCGGGRTLAKLANTRRWLSWTSNSIARCSSTPASRVFRSMKSDRRVGFAASEPSVHSRDLAASALRDQSPT
jgi:hypothetical protein